MSPELKSETHSSTLALTFKNDLRESFFLYIYHSKLSNEGLEHHVLAATL